jgi:cytochrome c oxidase subunit 1
MAVTVEAHEEHPEVQISSVGAFLLGASTLPFLWNVWISRHGALVSVDDPWGWGRSLEWATSCPPPRHNFSSLPRIRSESPAFDLHHPEVALHEYGDNAPDEGEMIDAPDDEGRIGHLHESAATPGDRTDSASQAADEERAGD